MAQNEQEDGPDVWLVTTDDDTGEEIYRVWAGFNPHYNPNAFHGGTSDPFAVVQPAQIAAALIPAGAPAPVGLEISNVTAPSPSAPAAPVAVDNPPPTFQTPPSPPPAMSSIPSPAFDINGNLVTVNLPGGDYSNLPAGYYTTPGQAAIARHVETQTGAPATAQQVGQLYSNPDATNQSTIQAVFNSPPPASTYVAPTPPVSNGWITPAVTPPPSATDLIAQMYVDNGLTPPPVAILTQIATGQIVAPLTDPLPTTANAVDIAPSASQTRDQSAADMTSALYAAQRPDLVTNWQRAHDAAWVAANPGSHSVVDFILQFPTLDAYLANDYGHGFDGTGAVVAPGIPALSPWFDSTHRSIGWDVSGKENFMQIDERGKIIAYASDGTNLRDLGFATMNAAQTAAQLLAQNPYKTNPHTGGQPSAPIPNAPVKKTNVFLWAAAIIVVGYAWNNR